MFKTIKNLDIYISDGNYSSKYPRSEEFVESGVPFIRGNNMIDGDIVDDEMYYITPEKHEILQKGHVKSGDVLITTRGNIGQVAIVPSRHEDSNINAQIVLLRTNPDEIYNRYLLWVLQSKQAKEQYATLQTGTALKQLPVGKLEQMVITVTDIDKQHVIADNLDKLYAIIKERRRQLELFDELIKARFVEMFGDLKSNDKDWKIVGFTDCADIDTNMVHDFEEYQDYPHIGIDSIEKETGRLIGYRTIAEDGVISGKYLFTPEHIIYSKIRPNLNKVAMPDFDGLCSADAYPILVKSGICNREYLGYTLRSKFFLDYILAFSSRTNLPKVNKNQVEGFKLPLPPIELQEQFAYFVKQVDKSKVAVQKSLNETKKLFDSLMQEYFG